MDNCRVFLGIKKKTNKENSIFDLVLQFDPVLHKINFIISRKFVQERVLFNIHLQKSESKQNIGCQYLRFGSRLSGLGSERSTCVRTKLTVLQKDITSRPFPQSCDEREFKLHVYGKR